MKQAKLALAGLLLAVTCGYAQEKDTNSICVVLKTQDGSSVVGLPKKLNITIETEFGNMSVPLVLLNRIEHDSCKTNTVLYFKNEDRLSGIWKDKTFELKTAFGDQEVPTPLLKSVTMRSDSVKEGLILYFTFDAEDSDVIHDKSGKGNNGVLCGAKYVQDGKVGGGIRVGRRMGYIQVPDNELWSFGMKPFTICLWLKLDALPYNEHDFIGHNEGGGDRNKWAFEFLNGNICFHINNPNNASFRIASYPWLPQIGKWHHLAVTRNGNLYNIYIDGACAATDNNQLPVPVASAPLTIGQAEGLYVEGMIDEVMIFDRALPADSIQQIYNAGK